MPAVHVTPIPVAAGGEDGAAGDASAVDDNSPEGAPEPVPVPYQVSGVSATAIPNDGPAAEEASVEDTSTQSIAIVQADAPAQQESRAPADTGDRREAPANPADATSTTSLTVVEAKSR